MYEYNDEEVKPRFILDFHSMDRSQNPEGCNVEQPVWEGRIDIGLKRAFEFGGYAELARAREGENGYIRFLTMTSLPGQFRITAVTNDPDRKKDVLEWWEPGDNPFRGTIVFGDDPWDARTVCTDLEVAMRIFRDMFEHGDLSEVSLSEMRSRWNPKPRDSLKN